MAHLPQGQVCSFVGCGWGPSTDLNVSSMDHLVETTALSAVVVVMVDDAIGVVAHTVPLQDAVQLAVRANRLLDGDGGGTHADLNGVSNHYDYLQVVG